jgi:hypothetical protein
MGDDEDGCPGLGSDMLLFHCRLSSHDLVTLSDNSSDGCPDLLSSSSDEDNDGPVPGQ